MAAQIERTPGNPASYKGRRAVVRHPGMRMYAGKEVDPGQVFIMRGLENDDRLDRLGFVEELQQGAETFDCRVCGARFSTMRSRNEHGRKRHEVRDVRPEPAGPKLSDVDRIDENSLISGDEPADDPGSAKDAPPLYLDRTAAALGMKPGPITL